MTIADAIMQTIIYSMLTICGLCLLVVLTLFVVLERPSQKMGAAEIHASSPHTQDVALNRSVESRVSSASQASNAVRFHTHISEMQVIGEEPAAAKAPEHIA